VHSKEIHKIDVKQEREEEYLPVQLRPRQLVLGQHIRTHCLLVFLIPHARLLEFLEKELMELCRNSSEILVHILLGTM
jgi:hypothetical protein